MNSGGSLNPQTAPLQNKTSFYYPLLLLPPDQRLGMELLYRFCWAADEIADNSDPLPLKRKKLTLFKKNLNLALSGKAADPLFKRFQKTIAQFKLSSQPLRSILKGIERDLKSVRFKKFGELYQYALQVAGAPGMAAMEIFGFKDRAHQNYAKNLGVFLQIVNITRDFQEDMVIGRQYFPDEDFKRFHLNPRLLGENDPHWDAFVRFQLKRAWHYLKKARQSLTHREKSHLQTAEAIASIYIRLYQKLMGQPQQILKGRVSLSPWEKLLSVAEAAVRCFLWRNIGDA